MISNLVQIKKVLQTAQIIAKSLGRDNIQPQDINILRTIKHQIQLQNNQNGNYHRIKPPPQPQIYSYVTPNPKILKIRDILAQTPTPSKTTIKVYQLTKNDQDQILPELYGKSTQNTLLSTIYLSAEKFGQKQLYSLIDTKTTDFSHSGHATRICHDINTRIFANKIQLEKAAQQFDFLLSNSVCDSRYVADIIRDALCQIYFTRKFESAEDLFLLGKLFGKAICCNPEPGDAGKRLFPILDDLKVNGEFALHAARFLIGCDVDFVVYCVYQMILSRNVDKSLGVREIIAKLDWEKVERFGIVDWEETVKNQVEQV